MTFASGSESEVLFGRVCGVMGWDEENLKLVGDDDREGSDKPVQPMTVVETVSLIQKQQLQADASRKKLLFSR
jgi:hypothetical protein